MSDSKSKFFIPAVGAALVVAGSVVAYMYFNGGPFELAQTLLAVLS